MQIETKNASLDMLAVTIRALHVSGKQMTLAVFRQLPAITRKVDIPDEYKVWGVVRYSIHNDHQWMVLSSGGRLYRVAVGGNSDHLPQLFIAV